MRRKLFAAVVFMTAGIAACREGFPIAAAGMIFPLATGGVFSFSKRNVALFLLAAYLLGVALMAGQLALIRQNGELDRERSMPMTLRVLSVAKQEPEKVQLVCRLKRVSGGRLPRWKQDRILLTWYREEDAAAWNAVDLIGAELAVSTKLSAPRPASNPRCFDYREYLYGRGIHHIAGVSSFRIVDDRPDWKERAVRRILRFRETFLDGLPCDDRLRGIVRGICFGDTSGMEEDIYEDFRSNGTAHVLAVSGLHIGLLYAFWRRVTRKRRGRGRAVVLILFLLFYGTMALWSPSVTRAILLIILVLAADLLERRYDMLTSVAFAAAVMIVRQPYAVFQTGFQMSFLAVLSMAFLCPFLERHVPQGVAAALAVQFGMLPYIAYTFNYIPLAALVFNVPILWLMGILIPAAVCTMAVVLLTGTGLLAGRALCGLTELLVWMNGLLAQGGRFAVDVVSPPLWLMVLGYGLLFFLVSEQSLIWRFRKSRLRNARIIALLALVTVLCAAGSRSPFDRAVFVMVDVGQGDCLHVRAGNGIDLLIDGGGREETNIGEKVLKPYLLKNGRREVDLALATHLHTDHYLGLQQLSECYPVRRMITKGRAGDVIRLGSGDRIELLWPKERNPNTEDENENSLIFKVHVSGLTMLVTGDLSEEGEAALIERYRGTDRLKCDLLKVCHHGSAYSSSEAFLDAVSPDAAVIGVGKNNYGHPAPSTLARFEARGIPVYRTDLDGAVGFWKKNGKLCVCRMIPEH